MQQDIKTLRRGLGALHALLASKARRKRLSAKRVFELKIKLMAYKSKLQKKEQATRYFKEHLQGHHAKIRRMSHKHAKKVERNESEHEQIVRKMCNQTSKFKFV